MMVADPSASYAVLVGTSRYTTLPALPAVQTNLPALRSRLTSPDIWGLPGPRCRLIHDPERRHDIIGPLSQAALDATDTLLVYFAGHGLIDPDDGSLHLALTGSDQHNVDSTAAAYSLVRTQLLRSRARRRVVILDCCFSGRALGVLAGTSITGAIDETAAEGTFVLTATAENERALSPPGGDHSALTSALLGILDHGIPGGGPWLDLRTVFAYLKASMVEKDWPSPQSRSRNHGAEITLFRNRAYRKATHHNTRDVHRNRSATRRELHPLRESDPISLGPYRLLNRLGEGGMGTVFLGEGPDGLPAAVKMIRKEYCDEPEYRQRFETEVAAARSVRSFCTARVLDSRLDGPVLYLVTEYIDGWNLQELVDRHGPYHGASLEQLAIGMATALAAIHQAGLIHRDLKPSNVLLPDVGLRVIDFGVARPLTGDGITAAGRLIGTPRYTAPEVLSADPITTAYDIFSWGSVVAFAGTGQPPFDGGDGGSLEKQLYRIAHDEPRLDGLAPELAGVVRATLAKKPADRPSAWELLQLLIGREPDHAMTSSAPRIPAPGGAFAVVGGDDEADYARRLVTYLRERGLPVRSSYEESGLAGRLENALALIVLISSGRDDPVFAALPEADRLGLRVLRILREGGGFGEAGTGAGTYDARDGSVPGERELAWLRRIAGQGPDPGSGVPSDDRFARLGRLLSAGRLVAADEESTLLVLRSARRADRGWLRHSDRLDPGFLRDLGTVWAHHTGGEHGFAAQLELHWGHRQPGSLLDFRALCAALGWSEKLSGKLNSYQEWVTRSVYQSGFFPTLRNPSDEARSGWCDRWRVTVMVAHEELRRRL